MWTDELAVDARAEDVTPLLPSAIEQAFGSALEEVEQGSWHGVIRRGDKRFTVSVTAHARGNDTVVRLTVGGRRSRLASMGLAAGVVAMIVAWVAGATPFLVNRAATIALPSWLGLFVVPAVLLTFIMWRLLRGSRFHTAEMLEPAERLKRRIAEIAAAPRIGGYREGLRIAATPDIDAASETEMELAEEEIARAER